MAKKSLAATTKKKRAKRDAGDIQSALPLFGAGEREAAENVFTVGGFLDYVNAKFAKEKVSIKGEISSFQTHPSGIYFSMKDKGEESVLSCYMSPWTYRSLGILLEEGMEIKAGGIANIYKPKGRFSFKVETVELAGEGSLKKAYEALKRKLEEEGLFERKRELPEFISTVGVITSRTGAVIDDFRKNLEKLGIRIYLRDARVEGARAAAEIIRAIRWFSMRMPELDVLVIIRGGGSLEDLQAFNNELVCREVFASKIPTIAGIGHDRDVPIASMVADRAASTPSIAAMMISNSWNRLKEALPAYESEVFFGFESMLAARRGEIARAANSFSAYVRLIETFYETMRGKIMAGAQKVDTRFREIERISAEQKMKMTGSFERILRQADERVSAREVYLLGVSPERNLKLGYSIITNKEGRVIKSAKDVKMGERILARLSQGTVAAKVEDIQERNG